MSKETEMSVVTINSLVKELVEEGTFIEVDSVQQQLGRPAVKYAFNYDKNHFLLLSLQEKKSHKMERELEVVSKIVNLAGLEKHEETFEFSSVAVESLIAIIQQSIQKGYSIEKIGLSIPGKIFNNTIISSWGNMLDGWNIENELRKITEIPIVIQNDAHLMTMGFCVENNLLKDNSIVGIFYPEKSMPGITIYSNGMLVEGNRGLAGEAKYLPIIIDSSAPETGQELATNLSNIISTYNVVIAPNIFVISSENIEEKLMKKTIESKSLLIRQPNEPIFYFAQDFQRSMTFGLRWLVNLNSIYEL